MVETTPHYRIVVDSDGCFRGTVRTVPLAYDTAKLMVSRILPPLGYELGIVDIHTGRQVSYMTDVLSRRKRLSFGQIAWGVNPKDVVL